MVSYLLNVKVSDIMNVKSKQIYKRLQDKLYLDLIWCIVNPDNHTYPCDYCNVPKALMGHLDLSTFTWATSKLKTWTLLSPLKSKSYWNSLIRQHQVSPCYVIYVCYVWILSNLILCFVYYILYWFYIT